MDWDVAGLDKDVPMPIGMSGFKSSYRALAWSFRKGRDFWRMACRTLRKTLNLRQANLRDSRKSQEMWRQRYVEEAKRAAELQARVKELEARLAAAERQPARATSNDSQPAVPCQPSPEDPCPKGGQYSASLMQLWIQLVTVANVPLNGVAAVLQVVSRYLGRSLPGPDSSTGRSWLLRLGWHELTRPLEIADDWIWIIDHTVQIGQQKVLVIVGLRAAQLPPAGQALKRKDLQLIALVPQVAANQHTVCAELERAVNRTGVPRTILSDHGADLAAGIRRFQERYPETIDLYDITHKVACLLKLRFESDTRWPEFIAAMSKFKNQVAQTELAGLHPTRLRPKARFMNIAPVIRWGLRVSQVWKNCGRGSVPAGLTATRVAEKLNWLDEFQAPLAEWSEWITISQDTLSVVRQDGYSAQTPARLQEKLKSEQSTFPSSQQLATTAQAFVIEQCQVRPAERLPGSSEVLESTFGKWKLLERQQSQGGVTGLILALGTLLGGTAFKTKAELILAWERSGGKNTTRWIKSKLHQTVTAQRRALLGGT